MVFSLGGWSPQLPTRFLVSRGTQDTASVAARFHLQAFHLLRVSFPSHSATIRQSYSCGPTTPVLSTKPSAIQLSAGIFRSSFRTGRAAHKDFFAPPGRNNRKQPAAECRPLGTKDRFGLLPIRSSLLRESLLISFPPVTEIFHFTGFASYAYVFSI